MPITVEYGDAPIGGAYLAGVAEARQRNAQIVAQQMAAQADQMRAMAANSAAQQQARDAAEERASRMQIAGAEIGSRFDLQNNEAQIQAQRDYRQADIQTQLNQTQLNQAEQMRLQRLQRQMNILDERGPNGDGTYTQPEIDEMKMQIQTGISPLQMRHQRAQELTDQLKQKLMVQQAQRDAALQATHQDLMNRIDPKTGLATLRNEDGEPVLQLYFDGHRMVPVRQRTPPFNPQRAYQSAATAVDQELRSFNTPPLPGQAPRVRPAWLQRDPGLVPILGQPQWPGNPLTNDEIISARTREINRRMEEMRRQVGANNGNWRWIGEHALAETPAQGAQGGPAQQNGQPQQAQRQNEEPHLPPAVAAQESSIGKDQVAALHRAGTEEFDAMNSFERSTHIGQRLRQFNEILAGAQEDGRGLTIGERRDAERLLAELGSGTMVEAGNQRMAARLGLTVPKPDEQMPAHDRARRQRFLAQIGSVRRDESGAPEPTDQQRNVIVSYLHDQGFVNPWFTTTRFRSRAQAQQFWDEADASVRRRIMTQMSR